MTLKNKSQVAGYEALSLTIIFLLNFQKCTRRKSEPGYYSSRESLPANNFVNNCNKNESEDDCLSASYMSEDNLGDYETLTYPCSKPNRSIMSSEDEDPAGDYVTFDYVQQCLSRDNVCASPSPAAYYRYYSKLANYDNLAHIWSELGTVDVDQLDLESEVESSCEASNKRPYIRRVQSFNNSASPPPDKEQAFQHSYSMRQSKKLSAKSNKDALRPNSLTLRHDSGISLRPPSGADMSNCPTMPIVWLKKQGDHLAENTNKSGSLPRSFLANQGEEQFCNARLRVETGKQSDNRPVTIASDKPEKNDFLDDFERYIKNTNNAQKRRSNKFPVSQEDCDDQRSLSAWTEVSYATSTSTEALHPEYKIYRHSNSRVSLRSVLASVSSKISSGIRNTLGGSSKLSTADQTHSCSNISLQSCDGANNMSASNNRLSTYSNSSYHEDDNESIHSKASISTRSSAKFVYSIAKAYGTMLKHRLKKAAEAASPSSDKQDPMLRIVEKPQSTKKDGNLGKYSQGSEAIGARIASQSDLDYCDLSANNLTTPKLSHVAKHNVINVASNVRPDSVLSESSNLTSSSNDSDKPKLTVKIRSISIDSTKNDNGEESVLDDSYYERSFEEIENLLENEMFRDSAIYSDQEDSDHINGHEAICKQGNDESPKPEVPCKPRNLALKILHINDMVNVRKVKGNAILETLENLHRNTSFHKEGSPSHDISGIKSIVERRKELEEWQQSSKSQPSSPEVIFCEAKTSDSAAPTPNDVVEDCENVRMKGWVKHLVGKFQSDCQ